MKRIVIVEDHPMVRERLSELINREDGMRVCGEAEDARGGVELIRQLSPDLAIVDITLCGSSGLELLKTLRASLVNTPVLILSMHDESVYAKRAFKAGASGYITKNRASHEVVSAVRHVLNGGTYQALLPAMKTISSRPLGRLSDRELAVLEMIGRGRSSKEIAEALGVGIATIDTYRARIKEKMNLKNAFELQHVAIEWLSQRE